MTVTTTITTHCHLCNKTTDVEVPTGGYLLWKARKATIQEALPTLTADEREMLMTGIDGACWDALYGEDEE